MSIALSSSGIAYVWGEGFSSLPIRVIVPEKIVDISGKLILTTDGTVYDITDTSKKIDGLYNIAKISCGDTHMLVLDVEGALYTAGDNSFGQCLTTTGGTLSPRLNATGVMEISAGKDNSIIQKEDRKVYVFGQSKNYQIRRCRYIQILRPNGGNDDFR